MLFNFLYLLFWCKTSIWAFPITILGWTTTCFSGFRSRSSFFNFPLLKRWFMLRLAADYQPCTFYDTTQLSFWKYREASSLSIYPFFSNVFHVIRDWHIYVRPNLAVGCCGDNKFLASNMQRLSIRYTSSKSFWENPREGRKREFCQDPEFSQRSEYRRLMKFDMALFTLCTHFS